MKLQHYPKFIERVTDLQQERFLFDFDFAKIKFKCIIFTNTHTILLSKINNKIVGHMVNVSELGYFNGELPSEFYYAVKDSILEETGEYKISPLWQAFDECIKEIHVTLIENPSNDQILGYIKTTKTSDKSYDKEGEKPFFETWRRNGEDKKASIKNLEKTERYFGRKVREICEKNRISSVWTSEPSSKSLDFLNVDNVVSELDEES